MAVDDKIISQMLNQQHELSAVEEFAVRHDLKQIPEGQARYRELIPKSAPGPGQQYAFEVDLDRCTGCKACVTACHNENGLDEDETWRSVGLIHGGPPENPAIQHITSACHHCLEPACASGCPVNAYEKDPDTGVVKHLDDQCIGCQYCILKCPYDVPKYSKKRGIVHKCDMCIGRLKEGEAPACVKACPSEAIRITVVDTQAVRKSPQSFVGNVPDAPASDYTLPTTQYKTKRKLPSGMVSSDYHLLKPEHSHMPLVILLVMTQLSVGAFLAEITINQYIDETIRAIVTPYHVLIGFVTGQMALAASISHLGRPLYAFRAVIGFKKSWMSREIVFFGLFAALSFVYALGYWVAPVGSFLKSVQIGTIKFQMDYLGLGVFLSGMLGIVCSVMIYKDTKRPFWDNYFTTAKFTLTTILLGFATIFFAMAWIAAGNKIFTMDLFMNSFGNVFIQIIMMTTMLKLLVEFLIFLNLSSKHLTFLKKTAVLMTGALRSFTVTRVICGIVGGIMIPSWLSGYVNDLSDWKVVAAVGCIFLALFIGEFIERYLFFRAVVPLKMPSGNVSL